MATNINVDLDTATKRVQTRLGKKSVKKSLEEIRGFFNTLDKEEFSKDDMDAAFNYFLTNAGNARDKALEIAKVYFLDLTSSQLDELSLLTSEEEIREAVYSLINLESKEEESKGELIKTTAQEFGVTLTAEEVYLVAQDINASSEDLTETLDEIKAAVINFINHKVRENSQKITQAVEEMVEVATDGLNKNSQELKTGLNRVNGILKGGLTDFKRISQTFAINKA